MYCIPQATKKTNVTRKEYNIALWGDGLIFYTSPNSRLIHWKHMHMTVEYFHISLGQSSIAASRCPAEHVMNEQLAGFQVKQELLTIGK